MVLCPDCVAKGCAYGVAELRKGATEAQRVEIGRVGKKDVWVGLGKRSRIVGRQ